jgi:hypothetical protein
VSEELERLRRAADVNERYRSVELGSGIVRRPAGPAAMTVHSLLEHLRAEGLTCVPEPIAVRDGVEVLRFIEGESGGAGWYHQHDDGGVTSAARLLRSIHDAAATWVPPADPVWGAPPVDGDNVVFCHGDPGPWNFVWRDNEAVGLIDWDYLHPAPRADDIAYAVRWFAPFRSDEMTLEWHHFPRVPNRRERTRLFIEAYGDLPQFDVAEAVIRSIHYVTARMMELAEQGVEPQRTWVADGAGESEEAEVRWIETHRALL